MSEYSVIPPTGAFGTAWPANLNLPQGKGGSISVGGWTVGNEGFIQQTFLGASIRNFDINAGFGDTTSSLSVRLINDEFNRSDGFGLGLGDDPYHNGVQDNFRPPVVGAPVFFKFGKNPATIEQAWRKTFDDLYGYNTIGTITFPTYTTTGEITSVPAYHYLYSTIDGVNTWVDKSSLWDATNDSRGYGHFVFGGIFQTYTQNKGPDGSPVYNAAIQDPREILSNCELILKNYAGTTFSNKNLFNLYGFLEYDVSDSLRQEIAALNPIVNNLVKVVNSGTGAVTYLGDDTYIFPSTYVVSATGSNFPQVFPITGQGFARVTDKGIPWYRVSQALTTLFEFDGPIPQEIRDKGFGGVIDFRGYKYVVDFSGIPLELIPNMYFLDFENIDMLSLVQELCDVISHDLYVSLLPVIDHPACEWLHEQNRINILNGTYSNIITGIIRVDAIDRSRQPKYGAIKEYIDNLQSQGIYVENQDVGYEVSNVVTDRFIVGAQETEMYYFTNNRDRDNLELRKLKNGQSNFYEFLQSEQWSLETSLKQQILPFYGFLGKDAVTIPRGFGSYQQIMLDSSHLDAVGVGQYYIATEMELRAASVSYQAWRDFLLGYNERYMSEVGEDQVLQSAIASKVTNGTVITGLNDSKLLNRDFAVDVPRCVFNSEKPYMGKDGYPASPCSPPYGYPLYYKRAEKIGIPEAGLTDIVAQRTTLITNLERAIKGKEYSEQQSDSFSIQIANIDKEIQKASSANFTNRVKTLQEARQKLVDKQKDADTALAAYKAATGDVSISKIDKTLNNNKHLFKMVDRLSRESLKNAHKVYAFVKEVADKHLGKTFLVKIPNRCNVKYNKDIYADNNTYEIKSGPFGFKPQPINTAFGYAASTDFYSSTEFASYVMDVNNYNNILPFESYLEFDSLANGPTPASSVYPRYSYGALKTNFNPISELWEFNYSPDPQGGFFNFALFNQNLSFSEAKAVNPNQLPILTQQHLSPIDMTNFIESNGRVKCYVRFNNSQYLDLGGISRDSFCQQLVTASGYVPDILEELNNVSQDVLQSFDAIQDRLNNNDSRSKAVAFVKCEVDSKFYMPPQTIRSPTEVFGRLVKTVTQNVLFDCIPVTGVDGCVTQTPVQKYPTAVFIPASGGGSDGTFVNNTDFVRRYNRFTDSNEIQTELVTLDKQNVYAIITLPGRIQPTLDSRYLDSVYQAQNTVQIKSLMTTDVVKGVEGFDKPAYMAKPKKIINATCNMTTLDGQTHTLSFKSLTNAIAASKDATRGMSSALPETLVSFLSPSPVYPDIVAIPMMSHERCYGPWLSSAVPDNPLADPSFATPRYSNIGGKVEFIKDESLAPWNYAGYQLMNEAGALKAQFSNSLLLFVERGGFVMAEAPTGIALARELQLLGPLVTSITVNIDTSIKTTVKMDLYSSRFGKLQKQKEIAVGQAVRERQRIIDQRNQWTRQGFKNGATGNGSFSDAYRAFDGFKNSATKTDEALSALQKKQTVYDRLVASVRINQDRVIDLNDTQNDIIQNENAIHMSVQSEQLNREVWQNFPDRNSFDREQYYSVTKTWDEITVPYSNDVHHGSDVGGLPHRAYTNEQAQIDLGKV